MTDRADELVVPRRFRGPATSGNGGWTAGALAVRLAGTDEAPQPPVRVRLSAPPPLETPLAVVSDGDTATATAGDRVVATATLLDDAAGAQLTPVAPVPYDAAVRAAGRYRGLAAHPFPECFSCGTAREAGDGLRLCPGPVDGVVATTWEPDESVADGAGQVFVPVLWAALDCPGGWAVDIAGRPMVLGTMTAWIRRRPRGGEPLVVVGRAVEVAATKALTATTLYRRTDELLAVAAHVWVAVDPATFGAAT